MQRLRNKRIVLGITGGIAAYKSAELVRQLTKHGAQVRVVMTTGACEFITPLTLQALSHHPVHLNLFDAEAEAAMGHIELARWADLILVAPATADFIARLSGGYANDLLTTLCVAAKSPICIAPAMNQAMWRDSITQQNCQKLLEHNIHFFGPASGTQACGDVGPGRMLEPELILESVSKMFKTNTLSGVKVMITAGPTHEAIDPVRYISNHSSGKMGYTLAEAAIEAGATVTLISGPVHLSVPDRVHCVYITSALEMYQAVHEHIAGTDIFIGCAAVSDYRPETAYKNKIKKDVNNTDELMSLQLVRNPDIIASVSTLNSPPFVVGFAAETQNVLSYAADKLIRKKLNLIIANNVSDKDIGFGSDINELTVLGDGFEKKLSTASKKVLSAQVLKIIAQKYRIHNTTQTLQSTETLDLEWLKRLDVSADSKQ